MLVVSSLKLQILEISQVQSITRPKKNHLFIAKLAGKNYLFQSLESPQITTKQGEPVGVLMMTAQALSPTLGASMVNEVPILNTKISPTKSNAEEAKSVSNFTQKVHVIPCTLR
eukprot:TRINITY_DN2953_c0_g1_i1.p2 TRINITY_DN2953_c0_g1~~TRINITY_DN2953_c0_g1_i1.p2  ORF type:complete len:114 (-),score=3.58 TRINITY_DN2953_c0_g1_i1:157-498(-)